MDTMALRQLVSHASLGSIALVDSVLHALHMLRLHPSQITLMTASAIGGIMAFRIIHVRHARRGLGAGMESRTPALSICGLLLFPATSPTAHARMGRIRRALRVLCVALGRIRLAKAQMAAFPALLALHRWLLVLPMHPRASHVRLESIQPPLASISARIVLLGTTNRAWAALRVLNVGWGATRLARQSPALHVLQGLNHLSLLPARLRLARCAMKGGGLLEMCPSAPCVECANTGSSLPLSCSGL
jgi:hypothetical protein